jgi:hypothetical protein
MNRYSLNQNEVTSPLALPGIDIEARALGAAVVVRELRFAPWDTATA